VTDVYNLQIDLTRPHVRPNALLQTVLPPYSTGKASPQLLNLCNGPFSVAEQKKDEIVFVANKNYFAAEQGQPREIAERAFESDREMVRALGDGRIKLIDRVNPWDLSKVRSLQDIEVRPYAVPLAHCLIPNVRKPLMSQRTFRRALIYGINRKSILDHLIGGVKMSGSSLLSGPFLRGESYDDPLGYAYDTTIKPRPYEPHLAIALAGVAVDMLAAAKAKKAKKEAVAADAKKDGKKSAEEQPPKKDEKKANSCWPIRPTRWRGLPARRSRGSSSWWESKSPSKNCRPAPSSVFPKTPTCSMPNCLYGSRSSPRGHC
ncbi:MAG: ABC transporter substrate-binding protein, partial [Chloroflexota bacterium]|nr:ABC transporter substrate-binding protein [Chloroflexota bacterium]